TWRCNANCRAARRGTPKAAGVPDSSPIGPRTGLTRGSIIGVVSIEFFSGFGTGLCIVIHDDAPGGRAQVVELAGGHRPEERPHGDSDQYESKGYQQVENSHAGTSRCAGTRGSARESTFGPFPTCRCTRVAFATTTSELRDIPSAAIHGASIPDAASGTAVRLYAIAHAMFCRMIRRVKRATRTPSTTLPSRFPSTTASAVARASAVPASSAMEASAAASTGASLMPSPTMTTFVPPARSFPTSDTLCSGSIAECHSLIPSLTATDATAASRSPLAINVRKPAL